MRTELFVASFVLTAIGLTLGYVFFNPLGFVLDGLGFMLCVYAIFAGDDSDEYENRPLFSKDEYLKNQYGEMYRCGYCRLFGSPRCERKEEFVNAEPCQKYWAKS